MGVINKTDPAVPVIHMGGRIETGAWMDVVNVHQLFPNQETVDHAYMVGSIVNHPTYGHALNAPLLNVAISRKERDQQTGQWSHVIWPDYVWAGLEWIAAQNFTPSVIIMSVEPDMQQTARGKAALDAVFAQGHAFVVSAGNSNMQIPLRNAGGEAAGWPASDERVIVVGNMRQNRERYFVQAGHGSDWVWPNRRMIYAVGDSVPCLGLDGPKTGDGTSFAAPQVAAMMALHMGRGLSAREAYEALFWAGHAMTSANHVVGDAKVHPYWYSILTNQTGIKAAQSRERKELMMGAWVRRTLDPVEYRRLNPDVAAAIDAGHFRDAHHHLEHFGFWEETLGRPVDEAFT